MTAKKGYRSLIVYRKSFDLAMSIFRLSKKFPSEERFGLTSQIRRSSRSTCANVVEAYRKRVYPRHFTNKLTTSDGENSETMLWLEFALACEYITQEEFEKHDALAEEIGLMLASMMRNPEKFKPRT
ncbi:MAG TPA: four helix bundle protein [Bacteroidia bacterium]|nr:four helix bundle protein [Bacteroidia bacterium]